MNCYLNYFTSLRVLPRPPGVSLSDFASDSLDRRATFFNHFVVTHSTVVFGFRVFRRSGDKSPGQSGENSPHSRDLSAIRYLLSPLSPLSQTVEETKGKQGVYGKQKKALEPRCFAIL